MVKKIINEIETTETTRLTATQLSRKLTLLDAVHLAKKSWAAVTTTTISNCFRKGGFVSPDSTLQQVDDDTPTLVPTEMTRTEFEQFVDIDLDIPCTGVPSDQDICSSILAERTESRDDTTHQADSDDEEVHPAVRPTSTQLLQALAVVRQGLEFNNVSDYSHYYKVEDQITSFIQAMKRQTAITEFVNWMP